MIGRAGSSAHMRPRICSHIHLALELELELEGAQIGPKSRARELSIPSAFHLSANTAKTAKTAETKRKTKTGAEAEAEGAAGRRLPRGRTRHCLDLICGRRRDPSERRLLLLLLLPLLLPLLLLWREAATHRLSLMHTTQWDRAPHRAPHTPLTWTTRLKQMNRNMAHCKVLQVLPTS